MRSLNSARPSQVLGVCVLDIFPWPYRQVLLHCIARPRVGLTAHSRPAFSPGEGCEEQPGPLPEQTPHPYIGSPSPAGSVGPAQTNGGEGWIVGPCSQCTQHKVSKPALIPQITAFT